MTALRGDDDRGRPRRARLHGQRGRGPARGRRADRPHRRPRRRRGARACERSRERSFTRRPAAAAARGAASRPRHALEIEPGDASRWPAPQAERGGRAGRRAPVRRAARDARRARRRCAALALLDELELTAVVLPELEALRGVVQNPNHHLDVHGHTLAVLEQWLEIESDLAGFAGDLAERVAALLAEPLADELDARRGAALRRAPPRHRQAGDARRAGRLRHLHRPRPRREPRSSPGSAGGCAPAARSAPTCRAWRCTTCASASWSTSARSRAAPSTTT